jgi:hypothetical protein
MTGCWVPNASNLRALHIAASSSYLSSRALLSLWGACSSLRTSPHAALLRGARQGRPTPRVGMQLFGTNTDAAVALLGWEPLEVAPKGPGVPACDEFLQLLSLGKRPSADEYNKLMAGAQLGWSTPGVGMGPRPCRPRPRPQTLHQLRTPAATASALGCHC